MLPVPVPLIVQFTSVLLRFSTVAVHCEVDETVTSEGVQEIVIVGVEVLLELEPQEVTMARAAASPKRKMVCFQLAFTRSEWSLSSNTRNPPARARANFAHPHA